MLKYLKYLFEGYPTLLTLTMMFFLLASLSEVVGITLLVSFFLALLTDSVIVPHAVNSSFVPSFFNFLFSDVKNASIFLGCLFVTRAWLSYKAYRCLARLKGNLTFDLKTDLLGRPEDGDLSIGHPDEYVSSINEQANNAVQGYSWVVRASSQGIAAAIMLLFALVFDFWMGVSVIASAVIVFFLFSKINFYVKLASSNYTSSSSRIYALSSYIVKNYRYLILTKRLNHFTSIYIDYVHKVRKSELDRSTLNGVGIAVREPMLLFFVVQCVLLQYFLGMEFTSGTASAIVIVLRSGGYYMRFEREKQSAYVFSGAMDNIEQIPVKLADSSSTEFQSAIARSPFKLRFKSAYISTDTNSKFLIDDRDVELGSIVLVKGESGSGKSTFLRAIAGFKDGMTHAHGVNFIDERGKTVDPSDIQFGYIAQTHSLYPGSVVENIFLDGPAKMDAVPSLIADLSLDIVLGGSEDKLLRYIDDYNKYFSGGEIQRIEIMRELLGPSKILLLDEPTSALDKKTESKVFDLIREKCNDRIVLMISHSDYAEEYADVIIDIGNKDS